MMRNQGPKTRAAPRFNSDALYSDLEKRRQADEISKREQARRVGLTSPSVLTRLSQGNAVSADQLVRFLVYLGTTDLGPYIDDGDTDA